MANQLSTDLENTSQVRVADGDIFVRIFIPETPRGMIVVAACGGFEDGTAANRRVREAFHQVGFATLSADLVLEKIPAVNLHTGEQPGGPDLLAQRLLAVSDWVGMQPGFDLLPLGYFGAGIGAEAAVIAAAKRPEVAALVAFGARLDSAEPFLGSLSAPSLFIHGAEDPTILNHERLLIAKLPETTVGQIEVIGWTTSPLHASHGIERVAHLAADWYDRYMTNAAKLSAAHVQALLN